MEAIRRVRSGFAADHIQCHITCQFAQFIMLFPSIIAGQCERPLILPRAGYNSLLRTMGASRLTGVRVAAAEGSRRFRAGPPALATPGESASTVERDAAPPGTEEGRTLTMTVPSKQATGE